MVMNLFTPREVIATTLLEALRRVERRLGVKLAVAMVYEYDRLGNSTLFIAVDVFEEIHRAELGGIVAQMFPAYDFRLLPMEQQMIVAVCSWYEIAQEHMMNISTKP